MGKVKSTLLFISRSGLHDSRYGVDERAMPSISFIFANEYGWTRVRRW